jgi:branched-chain amino acid transport system substrate-binding protein
MIKPPDGRQILTAVAVGWAALTSISAVFAETVVKVGFIASFTGPVATLVEAGDRAMQLYMETHQSELPAGVKIELIRRDDTGPNPDLAKRLAQELVVRDKVSLITGGTWTPNSLAIAGVSKEAKVPFIISLSGAAQVTRISPYVAKVTFATWQSTYPLGKWAAANGLTNVYSLIWDYAGGKDAEAGFVKGFEEGGGKLAGQIGMPINTVDYLPFVQRIKDAKPEAVFVFIPGGPAATAFMKAARDLNLTQDGVKIIGPGDITDDTELPNMGDAASGVMTVFHYTSSSQLPENRAFVDAWKKRYGADKVPNFYAVQGWDAAAAIYHVVAAQNGVIDPDKTMDLLKGWKSASPRGPIEIDPETRDIIQDEKLRRVDMIDGHATNVEIQTFPAVKDYWKVFNP